VSDEPHSYDNGGWLPPGCVAVKFMDEPEPVISTPTVIASYQQYIREHYGNEEK